MPHLPPLLLTPADGVWTDVVAIAALLGLLVTAWRHPRPLTEALATVVAGAAVLVSGATTPGSAGTATERLAPVVIFLVAILVVATVCARAGLFDAAASWVSARSGPRPVAQLLGVAVLGTVITTALSLDATVVLLTPVVTAVALSHGLSPRPGAWLCLRLANSASLLLPVANLTNLLAMPDLDVGFAGFAWRMAPVLAVVVVVETLAARWWWRRELAAPDRSSAGDTIASNRDDSADSPDLEVVPAATVIAMLVGFVAVSPFGIAPAWPAVTAAVLLAWWARRRGLLTLRATLQAGQPSFALYVLGLGVVVSAVAATSAGDRLAEVVGHIHHTGFGSLLAIALIATVVSNLVTNLSATLLIVPLVAPLGPVAVFAALLGLDIGAGLTYTGSLANLLWRRTQPEPRPGLAQFHRLSLTTTPVVLLAAVTTLWLFS